MFKIDCGSGFWNQSWLPEMLATSPNLDIQVAGRLGFGFLNRLRAIAEATSHRITQPYSLLPPADMELTARLQPSSSKYFCQVDGTVAVS